MWFIGVFSVPVLSFINKQAILALKVKMDVDHKSEMEDILNLYRTKKDAILELLSDKKVIFV